MALSIGEPALDPPDYDDPPCCENGVMGAVCDCCEMDCEAMDHCPAYNAMVAAADRSDAAEEVKMAMDNLIAGLRGEIPLDEAIARMEMCGDPDDVPADIEARCAMIRERVDAAVGWAVHALSRPAGDPERMLARLREIAPDAVFASPISVPACRARVFGAACDGCRADPRLAPLCLNYQQGLRDLLYAQAVRETAERAAWIAEVRAVSTGCRRCRDDCYAYRKSDGHRYCYGNVGTEIRHMTDREIVTAYCGVLPDEPEKLTDEQVATEIERLLHPVVREPVRIVPADEVAPLTPGQRDALAAAFPGRRRYTL